MPNKALAVVAGALFFTACVPADESPPAHSSSEQGRPETRDLRRIQVLGHDGTPIADKLDRAIEAQQQSPQRIDEAMSE